ncbi:MULTISPECIES: DUF447 domain-containing protein [Methylomonas]|uniref:Tetrahydromethanopterin synthesis protein n=1 Tax=Methylomonas koyamae TaxID=702114 RepID=A0A177N2K0_9GAMM|nr:DUF447 domain-containing protein [Methylomonas koyamae]OAI11430.1 tetrahydromethanopterin synthesis protein [Methylomonas koyamae]
MIQETVVTTVNRQGRPHIAPMGIHVAEGGLAILPFKPSTTLDNILETGVAVVNYCDDVRIFAGCVTGRRDWPLTPAEQVAGMYLTDALAHSEVRLSRLEEDEHRPKLFCEAIYTANHKPFRGFNRAQYAVLEAAILISRLGMLPWEKIDAELSYLRIGLDKTAGPVEREAWAWLMAAIADFRGKEAS